MQKSSDQNKTRIDKKETKTKKHQQTQSISLERALKKQASGHKSSAVATATNELALMQRDQLKHRKKTRSFLVKSGVNMLRF